jgi:sugar/nucleoside kinase (ribokinase family)
MPRSNFDVVTIGTAVRDVFLTSPLFKIVEDKEHLKKLGFKDGKAECFAFGGKIIIDRPIFVTGGGATNTAVTFARSGLSTGSIISLGDDVTGKEIVKELSGEGIRTFVSYSKDLGTGYDTILLNLGGERSILVYRGASNDLSLNGLGISRLKAKCLYVSPGGLHMAVVERAINHFHSKGAIIAINPSSHYLKLGHNRLSKILKKTAILTLNKSEAAILAGFSEDVSEKSVLKKLSGIVDGVVLITDGANGSILSKDDLVYRAGIFQERVLKDRTGAGDGFASAFVAAIVKSGENISSLTDKTIKEALKFASANATSIVENIGSKEGILTSSGFEKSKRFSAFSVRKTLL